MSEKFVLAGTVTKKKTVVLPFVWTEEKLREAEEEEERERERWSEGRRRFQAAIDEHGPLR